jgi:hypothetical protein
MHQSSKYHPILEKQLGINNLNLFFSVCNFIEKGPLENLWSYLLSFHKLSWKQQDTRMSLVHSNHMFVTNV